MTTINNGGPAFPVPEVWAGEQPIREGWNGMTLRDYFAAKAMPEIYRRVESGGFERVAALSYEMADAMLHAREAK